MYDAAVCLMKMISSAGEIALMGISSSQDEGGGRVTVDGTQRWLDGLTDAWRAFHSHPLAQLRVLAVAIPVSVSPPAALPPEVDDVGWALLLLVLHRPAWALRVGLIGASIVVHAAAGILPGISIINYRAGYYR